MSSREAFGPNLRRQRLQRGVTLTDIATATKVNAEVWAAMERNEFSKWPKGLYARAYVRAYAEALGLDPTPVVDEFCRYFPEGDRRAEAVVRGQAEIVGHELQWVDDLLPEGDRRAVKPTSVIERVGAVPRIVAAIADTTVVVLAAALAVAALPVSFAAATAAGALLYHGVAMVALGGSPAGWIIDQYIRTRQSELSSARALGILRVEGSERAEI